MLEKHIPAAYGRVGDGWQEQGKNCLGLLCLGYKCFVFPNSTSGTASGKVMEMVTLGSGRVIVLALDFLILDRRKTSGTK